MIEYDKEWLVLRCASSRTLALAEKLIELGMNAWTPMWRRKRRLPRDGKYETVMLPCIPSFVFLVDADIHAIYDDRFKSALPPCRLMYSVGRLVRCSSKMLAPLCKISDVDFSAKPIEMPAVGTVCRINDGAFMGLTGKVIGHTPTQVIIELVGRGWFPVKISPFLLDEDAA